MEGSLPQHPRTPQFHWENTDIIGTPSRLPPLLSAERGGKSSVERGIVIFLLRR